MFSVENLKKKETTVILERIDQLPQNLARVHNLGPVHMNPGQWTTPG